MSEVKWLSRWVFLICNVNWYCGNIGNEDKAETWDLNKLKCKTYSINALVNRKTPNEFASEAEEK